MLFLCLSSLFYSFSLIINKNTEIFTRKLNKIAKWNIKKEKIKKDKLLHTKLFTQAQFWDIKMHKNSINYYKIVIKT